tara:strand:+ start:1191 stop:1658 length:468 start_codon:yes stop_codon:yes gene_type:complete
MNIVLQLNDFYIGNVNLLKKKKNVVVDGIFTKFTYSNEYFIMNGIYLKFPVINPNIKVDNKMTIMTYSPYEKENIEYLQYISNMELQLLEYYNYTNNIRKTPITILSKKLFSGNIKSNIYSLSKTINNIITIKISGIWETDNEIGLAIKLIFNQI